MSKGGNFEREFCKMLSVWWSRKGDEDIFWRTQASGARATMRAKRGKKTRGQYGDVCAVDSRGNTLMKAFTISLKRGYQSMSLQDVMDQIENRGKRRTAPFEEWIKECIQHQRSADSLAWLLILRKNRREALVFMPLGFALFMLPYTARNEILETTPCVFFRLETPIRKTRKKRIINKGPRSYLRWYLKNNACIFGIRLKDFLWTVDRDVITEVVRNHAS
jgi:hypothetical protein